MVATYRECSFAQLVAATEGEDQKVDEFDYLMSDGTRLKTERKLLKEAIEAAES